MSTYSAIVNDVRQWDAASNATRVAIAKEVAEKLGEDYMYVGFKLYRCGGQTHEIMAIEHQPTLLVFHIIPGGTFMLGSSEHELAVCAKKGWKGDLSETPVHEMNVRAFLLCHSTATEGAIRAMTGGSDRPFKIGEEHPEEAISRSQAQIWCRHFGLRLPTEAEWEYACRAGTKTVFFWGDEPDHSYCWMKDNYGDPEADEYVNHKFWDHLNKTNAFGLIDMLGSVGEWVKDDSHPYEYRDPEEPYYTNDESRDPDGILRGGCFMYDWKFNRCATRIKCSDYGDTGIGFRPARDIPALEGKLNIDPNEVGKSQRVNPAPAKAPAKKPWWKIW